MTQFQSALLKGVQLNRPKLFSDLDSWFQHWILIWYSLILGPNFAPKTAGVGGLLYFDLMFDGCSWRCCCIRRDVLAPEAQDVQVWTCLNLSLAIDICWPGLHPRRSRLKNTGSTEGADHLGLKKTDWSFGCRLTTSLLRLASLSNWALLLSSAAVYCHCSSQGSAQLHHHRCLSAARWRRSRRRALCVPPSRP